jgi:capsular exopolysaccharide synthesis family protein
MPEPSSKSNPEQRPIAGRIEPNVAEATPPPGATPEFGSMMRSLRRRWMAAAVLGGLCATVAGLAAWLLLSPKFTAAAQVRVLSYTPILGGDPKDSNLGSFNTAVKTQSAYLKSRPVINAALKRDDVKKLNLGAAHSDVAAFLEDEIKVETLDQSELITVTFSYADPQVATTIVKAIVECYMDQVGYGDKHTKADRVAELEKSFNDLNASLKNKKQNYKRIAENLGSSDPFILKQIQDEVQASLRDMRGQRFTTIRDLQKTRNDLASLEQRAKAAEKEEIADKVVEKELETDLHAKPLLIRIVGLREILQRHELSGNTESPTYLIARAHMAEIEPKLEAMKKTTRETMQKHLAAKFAETYKNGRAELELNESLFAKQLEELDKQIQETASKAGKLVTAPADLDNLQREIARDEQILDEQGKRLEKERLEMRAPPRISVHQDADLQKKDIKKQVIASIGAPIGILFLVCAGVAYADYRQRRVYSTRDVANGLGIRVVGAVPEVAQLEQQVIGGNGQPDLEGQPVMESIDAIRTLLLHDAQRHGTSVVLVTSAAAGEGKTTVASHLASSLARAGRKTLLIDGDLRRPAVHQLFEVPMQPGFSEALLGEVELEDAVQDTTLPGLTVMPAGQWDREVLQALARGSVEGIFEKLRAEFDFILVDSHPVHAATDALVLGQQADAVLLSVLKGVSEGPRVHAAARRLTELGARVLGAVLCGADSDEVFASSSATVAPALG